MRDSADQLCTAFWNDSNWNLLQWCVSLMRSIGGKFVMNRCTKRNHSLSGSLSLSQPISSSVLKPKQMPSIEDMTSHGLYSMNGVRFSHFPCWWKPNTIARVLTQRAFAVFFKSLVASFLCLHILWSYRIELWLYHFQELRDSPRC